MKVEYIQLSIKEHSKVKPEKTQITYNTQLKLFYENQISNALFNNNKFITNPCTKTTVTTILGFLHSPSLLFDWFLHKAHSAQLSDYKWSAGDGHQHS